MNHLPINEHDLHCPSRLPSDITTTVWINGNVLPEAIRCSPLLRGSDEGLEIYQKAGLELDLSSRLHPFSQKQSRVPPKASGGADATTAATSIWVDVFCLGKALSASESHGNYTVSFMVSHCDPLLELNSVLSTSDVHEGQCDSVES